MKIIKRALYFILILIMLLCAAILVCAFNPSLTNALAAKVSGGQNVDTKGDSFVQTPEIGDADSSGTDQIGTGNASGQETVGVYVPPASADVTSPDSVKNKNGYEPVLGNSQEIADEDAENLQDKLQTGDVGDEFSFDPLFYPYYAMLNQDKQALYRQIYANAMELTTSFAPVVTLSVAEVKDVFEAVYNDHPELFWLETEYSCKYLRNGQCIEVTLEYYKIADELEDAKKQFEAAAQEIIQGAKGLAGDAEKEKYVHDALIEKVDYHAGTSMSQSAYSALVSGRSVCAGYARAFQYIMMELDIPCYYCMGYSGEDHAWNIVKLEDGYYNVDVTWDDTDPSTYDYYNKTDADYAKTHMRKGMSNRLPACNADDYRIGGLGGTKQENVSSDNEESEERDADSLINDNPQQPLTWYDEEEKSEDPQSDLDELGLKEEDILDNLEEYYADCLKQMTEAGTGQQQFTNVIPKSLWQTIERIYSDGSYKKGYVDEALKKMQIENFAIQLQTERLNGSYYKLYHNISTW